MWYWFQQRRLQCVVALTLLWSISIWMVVKEEPLLPSYFREGMTSASNLKVIMTQWIIQQYENPDSRPFYVERAKKVMPSRPSPWSEVNVARREFALVYALTAAPFYVFPTLIFAVLLLLFIRRRARRAMIAVVALLVVLLIMSADPRAVAAFVFPGRYSFIQDYVYIADVDLTSNPNAEKTIAAYDWRSFEEHYRMRVIGFADGHVMRMGDREAKQAFATSGLAYPDVPTENR